MVWKIQNSFFTYYLLVTACRWCRDSTYRLWTWINFDNCNCQKKQNFPYEGVAECVQYKVLLPYLFRLFFFSWISMVFLKKHVIFWKASYWYYWISLRQPHRQNHLQMSSILSRKHCSYYWNWKPFHKWQLSSSWLNIHLVHRHSGLWEANRCNHMETLSEKLS